MAGVVDNPEHTITPVAIAPPSFVNSYPKGNLILAADLRYQTCIEVMGWYDKADEIWDTVSVAFPDSEYVVAHEIKELRRKRRYEGSKKKMSRFFQTRVGTRMFSAFLTAKTSTTDTGYNASNGYGIINTMRDVAPPNPRGINSLIWAYKKMSARNLTAHYLPYLVTLDKYDSSIPTLNSPSILRMSRGSTRGSRIWNLHPIPGQLTDHG